MQRKWSVLIIPNTSEEGYNVTFTASAIRTGIIAVCLLMVAGSVFCAASLHIWKKSNQRQITQLKDELAQQQGELVSLKNEYASVVILEEKLRTLAGLKPRHSILVETAAGGQGGPAHEGTGFLYEADDEARTRFLSDLRNVSAGALREGFIDARESFAEILEAFVSEEQRLSCIPSINPVCHPDAWISSPFGHRRDPINGKRSFHDGIDIVAPRRTPVIAPAEGEVISAGWRDGLGRAVEIRHGYGYHTIYGHNDKLMVKKGEHVSRGDVIALIGSSGRSTAPHLHYEVRLDGKRANPYRYVID